MPDFLLELLSEEIPARMQERARADLARLFADEIGKAGLRAASIATFSTPRRLALIARGLPAETAAVRDELKGPRASAPPQALDGFLRKTGLSREQLEERDGVFFAVIDKPGRATAAVLAEAIPAIVRAFPWPKSMRWGAASLSTESLRWVRPLHGIVALFGGEIVPCAVDGIESGAETVGHRFHHPGRITIGGADDYAAKLRACHVIVDQDERRALIAEAARAAASAAGLQLVEDEGLLTENAGLTEWPVPLLGHFDPAFLEVPREVIQLTMRTNQKYFACLQSSPGRGGGRSGDQRHAGGMSQMRSRLAEQAVAQPVEGGQGQAQADAPLHHPAAPDGPPPRAGEELELAPNFVCVANIDAHDGGRAIVAGNQKVLAARLSDAKFFWEQDLKVPLADQAAKLNQIVFHEKLGTVADKVERVARLARWLVEEGIIKSSPGRGGGPAKPVEGGVRLVASSTPPLHHQPAAGGPPPRAGEDQVSLADMAEQAARLCKADLVTGMVGEFPELQGVMGGYYARAQGYPDAVADAIRDHYKPVGQGDEVPTAPVTVAVSLADKLDSLAGFFAVDEKPTGSKDPFALRRSAIGVVATIVDNSIHASIRQIAQRADFPFAEMLAGSTTKYDQVVEFMIDRLKVQQREAGVRHDLIDAVFALGGEDDLVRLLARVKALQAFVETPEGADLLAGYKRAANILKKENWSVTPAKAGVQESAPLDSGLRRNDETGLSYTPLPEEAAMIAALNSAEPLAEAAVEREDFEGAMAALATLRAPVDAFFDKVTVNDPDPVKREARLNLLARMREAVHRVADFSKIEG